MDKYELTIKIEKLDKLVKSGDYVNAAKVAEQIEWKKMKQWTVMSNAIDAFAATGKYDKARNVCIYAYNRKLGGRRLLATLMEMYIKLGEFDDAEEIYQEYVELAPRDVTGYILLYKLKRAKKAPVEELITILQNYKDKELDEEYEYELALLYSEAGLTDKCVRECDELVLWFADGIYVEKALRLKQMYVPLTPGQAEKLARLEKLSAMGINSSDVFNGNEYGTSQNEVAAAEAEPETAYEAEGDYASGDVGAEKAYAAGSEYDDDYESEDDANYESDDEVSENHADYESDDEVSGDDADYEADDAMTEDDDEYEEDVQAKYAGNDMYEASSSENAVSDGFTYQKADKGYKASAVETEAESDNAGELEKKDKPIYIDDIENTTEWSPIEIDNAMASQSKPVKTDAAVHPQPAEKKNPEPVIRDDMRKLEPDYDINIKVPDYSVYDTRNVQQELKANVNEIMEAYKNRERTEALREAAQLEDAQEDSDPTKEIIINKHQWRKASRNTARAQEKAQGTESSKASHGDTQSGGALPDLNSLKNADIREVTQQLTLEQMSELVAQLQAEQERRRKEAEAKNADNSSKMDISQWLADLDEDNSVEHPDSRATRRVPVEEVNKAVKSGTEEESKNSKPQQVDYSKEEREALERTVREIAASAAGPETESKEEPEAVPQDELKEPVIEQQTESIEEEFEEIPDVEESEAGETKDDDSEELPDLEHAINAGIEQIIEDNAKASAGVSDSGRYLLKDEERAFLDRYLYMSGMEKRLCRYIGAKRAEALGRIESAGHIAIMGNRTTDKIAFAINLFKALHVYDSDREQKLARISAEKINEKGYEAYADKLANQTLVIENAGRLKRETLVSMFKFSRNTLFIIVDEEFEINKLFAENPDMAEKFTGCFLLKQYTVNELVDIAKDYAEGQGWRVEDKALLKLYLILSQIPNDDQGNVVDLVKEIMNHAAKHAENRFGNKLFGRFRSVLTIKEGDLRSDDEYEDEDDDEYASDEPADGGMESEEQEDEVVEKPKKSKKSRAEKKKKKEAKKKASSDEAEDKDEDYDEADEYDDDYDDDDEE